MYFINDAGLPLCNDMPNEFSNNFDWIVMNTKTLKKCENPKTIYVKTDFLSDFVHKHLENIRNKFILITAASDYSPSVNFPAEYDIIVNHPLLLRWYCNNKIIENPKVSGIPAGMCSYSEEYQQSLLTLRRATKNIIKIEKILCVWRDRPQNVCGQEFAVRSSVKKCVLNNPVIFDWYEPDMTNDEFIKLLIRYKYILCPVGNGVDPCPKSFEAITVNTIPIMLLTNNTKDVYKNMPAIMVNRFEEILQPNYLETKYNEVKKYLYNDDTLYRLSAEYWAAKIKSGQPI